MRSLFFNVVAVLVAAVLTAASPGCTHNAASDFNLGQDSAHLEKDDSFNGAEYEYSNAKTGEYRHLVITGARGNPNQVNETQARTNAKVIDMVERQLDRVAVPGIVAPTAPPVTPPAAAQPPPDKPK